LATTRERFLSLMSFEPGARSLRWEFGYWASTVRRWYDEGLPRKHGIPDALIGGAGVRGEATGWYDRDWESYDLDVHDLFGMDDAIRRITFNNLLCPRYPIEVIAEEGMSVLVRDAYGGVTRQSKDNSTLPDVVSFGVQKRDDWERLKAERLRPVLSERVPANWESLIAEYRSRDYPLAIGGATGFFGTPRYLMGPEGLLMGYYDQPELVHDMVDYLADFWIALYDQVLDLVDADLALIWEDMSYKAGSLISPATFREFMLPAYKKVTGFLRDRGVRNIWVDTDGDCWQLIPLMMEGGVTGIYPMEVRAGMDIVAVREAFPRLQIMGGIDKTAVAEGPVPTERELEKARYLLARGGYIPYIDHFVHPEIALGDFAYYRRRLGDLIDSTPTVG
jgi:uroporphyrinogen decarboxylase